MRGFPRGAAVIPETGRRSGLSSQENRTMKVCMVAYSFYEGDNRVRRYAETLARRGDRVDVVSLRQKGQPPRGIINGVHVFRIQRRVVNEKSKFSYLGRLLLFFMRSMAF